MRNEQLNSLLKKASPLLEKGYGAIDVKRELRIPYRTAAFLVRAYSSGSGSCEEYRAVQRKERTERPCAVAFGTLFSESLKRAGKTIWQFASELGMSYDLLRGYGKSRKIPKQEARIKIYKGLGINPDYAEELIEAAVDGRIEMRDIEDSVKHVLENNHASIYIKPKLLEKPESQKRPPRVRHSAGEQQQSYASDPLLEKVITIDDFSMALRGAVREDSGHGISVEDATDTAERIMNFFGFSDVIIDNVLTQEERDLFYELEDLRILQIEREEISRETGKNWRIKYWGLNKGNILKLAENACDDEAAESADVGNGDIYSDMDPSVWINHARNPTQTHAKARA